MIEISLLNYRKLWGDFSILRENRAEYSSDIMIPP